MELSPRQKKIGRYWLPCEPRAPISAARSSSPPHGLTLIELLVTIVIMVTVLGAVIPLMSPNNNSRKIREASRQLNSLIQQAQALAAREGRPAGIAFHEFGIASPFSGMALEAYLIAEPEPFAGFSDDARVDVTLPGITYGPAGNGGTTFSPQYDNAAIYRLNFYVLGGIDSFPPRMLRIGDTIHVAGNMFMVVDDEDETSMPNQIEEDVNGQSTGYLLSDPTITTAPISGTTVDCVWINSRGQALATSPSGGPPILRPYIIVRQPATTTAQDQPMQFPRGIGIDMQASGATPLPGFGLNFPLEFDVIGGTSDVIGIMFRPDGSLGDMFVNGRRVEGINRIYMLVGIFENGDNASQQSEDYDFVSFPVSDADNLAQRRGRINWLHPDSRWIAINQAGRTVVATNNQFDPMLPQFTTGFDPEPPPILEQQQRRQINAARAYAAEMQSEGGR